VIPFTASSEVFNPFSSQIIVLLIGQLAIYKMLFYDLPFDIFIPDLFMDYQVEDDEAPVLLLHEPDLKEIDRYGF